MYQFGTNHDAWHAQVLWFGWHNVGRTVSKGAGHSQGLVELVDRLQEGRGLVREGRRDRELLVHWWLARYRWAQCRIFGPASWDAQGTHLVTDTTDTETWRPRLPAN
jgi:hypothetical protein